MAIKENWVNLPRTMVRPGVNRRVFSGDRSMMVLNELAPGSKPNMHKHPHEQLTYIIEGTCNFYMGNETLELQPGDVLLVPPDMLHGLEVTGNIMVLNLDVFSPVREDYLT